MDRTHAKWDRMVRKALECKGVASLDFEGSRKQGKKKQFRYQGV